MKQLLEKYLLGKTIVGFEVTGDSIRIEVEGDRPETTIILDADVHVDWSDETSELEVGIKRKIVGYERITE